MIKKIKKKFLRGVKLAEYCENNGEFDEAYKEYLNIGNHIKAGEVLEKAKKWHEAAKLYITNNQIDLARRAIENCFIRDDSWEFYELDSGDKVLIEDWLKQKRQARRFVRYIRYTETLNNKGIPLIVVLADKLKKVLEYKSAADLYRIGFDLTNKEKNKKTIQNEVWLRYAAECYSKVELYKDAAQCMKALMLTEVDIGVGLPADQYNPYRDYTHSLQAAKEWNFLDELIEILEDFDPFNISYDLLKIGEYELSIKLFFKFYGRVIKKAYSDEALEIRNKKIQYCLNQYVIYYSKKKEYSKAAEIALLDSQKEIAADLFKKAALEKEKFGAASSLVFEDIKTTEEPGEQKEKKVINGKEGMPKCPTCGEFVEPDSEICPSCNNVLNLELCVCGEKIKPDWKRCPACQRNIGQLTSPGFDTFKDISINDDTKPFKELKR